MSISRDLENNSSQNDIGSIQIVYKTIDLVGIYQMEQNIYIKKWVTICESFEMA
jgi:hypothetical protein